MSRSRKEDGLTRVELYEIGMEASRHLPKNHNLVAIARVLGTTKQGAQYLVMTALGKLVCRLKKEISDGR